MCVSSAMGFPGGSVVKNPPAMQETRVWSLSQEDPLEKEMATHSSTLAWEIPRTEEPCGLTVHGITKRVGGDWATKQQSNNFQLQKLWNIVHLFFAGLLFFFFFTALWRYNSYTTQYTHLNHPIHWFWVYSQNCATITSQRNPDPWALTFPSPLSPLSLSNH